MLWLRPSSPQNGLRRARCPDCGAAHSGVMAFCTECGCHLKPDTGDPGWPTVMLWTAFLCLSIAAIAYLTP